MKPEHEDKIKDWWLNRSQSIFVVSGFAGCGKTTLARQIPDVLKLTDVAYLAPTGKAALVIGEHGKTIHSFLYDTRVDPDTKELIYRRKSLDSFTEDLIIVDEISMVGSELLDDLRQLRIPIIGLGDSAQLPPVNADETYLLDTPDIFLTEVFRMDGGLLKLATDVRQGVKLSYRYQDVTFAARNFLDDISKYSTDAVLICKFNSTRHRLNKLIREDINKFVGVLEVGEKLVVTKNNRETGLMNGSIITVTNIYRIESDNSEAIVGIEDQMNNKINITINIRNIGGNLWKGSPPITKHRTLIDVDYAYAITCHKAQGSEFDRVFVINEGANFPDHKAWLYTAVTRAKKELRIYRRI